MKKRYWIYALIHVLILMVLAVGLVAIFPPVARLMQSVAGELTMPQHVSSHEERLNWEMWIARGYGEGVNTVGNLIFFILGMVLPGLAFCQLAIPNALKWDSEMDPTDITIPVGLRSTLIAATLIALLVAVGGLLTDSQWAGRLLASGFTMVGFMIMPYFAMALLSMYLGVYVWKRMNWRDDDLQDDKVGEFYKRLKK